MSSIRLNAYVETYMGETKGTLSTRLKEHKAACRLAAFERSAVAEHAWQEGRRAMRLIGTMWKSSTHLRTI